MVRTKIHELAELRQSVWLDFIQRSLLNSGGLENYIVKGLRGMTSNPAIFAEAIGNSEEYDAEIQDLALKGNSAVEIFGTVTVEDVQAAADIFRPIYDQTHGLDGYVSLEVNPHLARNTQETLVEARRLTNTVDRPNVMIKVPATPEGLIAIRDLTAEGLNINVTLMFSLSQYELVTDAFFTGLEQRAEKNLPLETITSVASIFVSRIDVKVDEMLDSLATPAAFDLKGKIGIANAKMIYQRFRELFHSERWHNLSEKGARLQRVLFGSTSTKNPAYPDTMYPDNLIGPNTINTLPPETLEAFIDHGSVALTLENKLHEAMDQLKQLDSLEIDLERLTQDLLEEGIQKFTNPYETVIETITEKMVNVIKA
jgi:transaldolase